MNINKNKLDNVGSMLKELEEYYKKKGIEKHYSSFDDAQEDIDDLIYESGFLDKARKELKEMEQHPENYKRYSSFDEALKDIEKDKEF